MTAILPLPARTTRFLRLMITAGLVSLATTSAAATFTDTYTGFANDNAPGSTFSRSIYVDGWAVSDGKFDLTGLGDFNMSYEYVSVSIEGFSLGSFFASRYNKGQYKREIHETATIALDELRAIIADGVAEISYTLSSSVHNLTSKHYPDEYLTAALSFDTGPAPAPVPLPVAGLLLLGGIGALGLVMHRKRKA